MFKNADPRWLLTAGCLGLSLGLSGYGAFRSNPPVQILPSQVRSVVVARRSLDVGHQIDITDLILAPVIDPSPNAVSALSDAVGHTLTVRTDGGDSVLTTALR